MKKASISIVFHILLLIPTSFLLTFAQGEAELKYLRVATTDSYGRHITGLKKENFTLKIDGIKQEIEYFSDREEPASILILVDISDSLKPEERVLNSQAALYFLQKANPANDYAVVSFGKNTKELADWGSNDKEILSALQQVADIQKGDSSSAYRDALEIAVKKLEKASKPKKVLLVFSDGSDTASNSSVSQIKQLFKRSDVVFYNIGIRTGSGREWPSPSERDTDDLVKVTGGLASFTPTFEEFKESVERVVIDLASQYTLGYTPKPSQKKREWSEVKVDVSIGGMKSKIITRSRAGYFNN